MKLVLATDTALCVADNTGDAWRTRWHDSTAQLECVAGADGRMVAGTAAGHVLQWTGDAWAKTGSMADRITALAISPHNSDRLWAGTEPSRLYRSADGGETWIERPGLTALPSADRWSFPPRPDTHHVRWIVEDVDEPGRLYLAIEAGAFVRSPDGGETFVDHPDGARRDNHTIAMHPDTAGRLYVAAGDGYAESPDRGDSWTYPQDGLEHRYVWGLAVAPDDPEILYVSAARGAYAAHDPEGTSYVYRRRDGTWEPAMAGLPGPEGLGRAVLAAGGGELFAATNHGVFRRTNGAWTGLGLDWPAPRSEELPRGLAVVA